MHPWSARLGPLLVLSACGGPGPSVDDTDDTDPVEDTDDTEVARPSPIATALDEDTATVGTVLTLTGEHFGDAQDTSTLTVDGQVAQIRSWSATSITFSVPDVLPGPRQVVVTAGDLASGAVGLTVVLPPRLYVSSGLDVGEDTVAAYAIASNGELSGIPGSPVPLGALNDSTFGGVRGSMAVDVAHRRLFVAGDAYVAVFAIDGASGALTAVPGSPFEVSTGLVPGLAVSPDGAHLYASRCDEEDLAHYEVDADGALTAAPVPSYDLSTCANQVLVDPTGTRLHTGDESEVRAFTVGSGGTLTAVPGTPFLLSGRTYGRALDAAGSRLFVSTYNNETLHVFDVEVGGKPVHVAGSPFSLPDADASPMGVALTSDGSVAYVALWQGDAIGIVDLTPAGAPTWRGSVGSVEEPAPLALSADGSLLFVLGQNAGSVQVFAVRGDRGLTAVGSPTSLASGAYPQALVVVGR